MIESQFTCAVHKKLSPNVYHWKINDNFAGGVPDAFYRVLDNPYARPLWVEYKFLKMLPSRDSTVIIPKLSVQQLLWLEQARSSGELACVIMGVYAERVDRQVCGFFLHDGEWTDGITRSEAKKRLMPISQIAETLLTIMTDSVIQIAA